MARLLNKNDSFNLSLSYIKVRKTASIFDIQGNLRTASFSLRVAVLSRGVAREGPGVPVTLPPPPPFCDSQQHNKNHNCETRM